VLKEEFRLRNDLYCVEWGVKLYSLTLKEKGALAVVISALRVIVIITLLSPMHYHKASGFKLCTTRGMKANFWEGHGPPDPTPQHLIHATNNISVLLLH